MLKFDDRVLVLGLVPRFRCMCVLDDPTIFDSEYTGGMAILGSLNLLLRRIVRQPVLRARIRAHTLSLKTNGERGVGIAVSRDAGGFCYFGSTRWNKT